MQYQVADHWRDYVDRHGIVVMEADQPNNGNHSHVYFELGYMLRGTAKHYMNGDLSIIRPGDFFIMDLNSIHAYYGDSECQMVNLLFFPRVIDPALDGCRDLSRLVSHFLINYLPRNIGKFSYYIFHDSDGSVLRLIGSISRELRQNRSGKEAMVRAQLIELLVTIMRQSGETRQSGYSTLTQDILTIIHQKYAEPLTLKTIGDRLGYTVPYLSRIFSENVGISFTEYLQFYRLEMACHLLLTENQPVAQIAEAIGYRDVRFFYKLFKKTYGVSPSTFRRQADKEKKS